MEKAEKSLERLMNGYRTFRNVTQNPADISPERRASLAGGQNPFAVVLSCSDSRVAPEMIFSAGPGDLFVVRVAGNVLDDHQLGSIEYAVDHLGAPLVVVLGHTHCGAVHAAIHQDPDGHIRYLTDCIREAIGDTTDEHEASRKNVRYAVDLLREHLKDRTDVKVTGMMYDIEDSNLEVIEDILWE